MIQAANMRVADKQVQEPQEVRKVVGEWNLEDRALDGSHIPLNVHVLS